MKIGLGLVAIAVVVAAGALVAMRFMTPYIPPPIEGTVNVRVINGATKTDLTLTQLLQMNPVTGTAMFQNVNHNWQGYALYKGVRLSAIIETVGTMSRYNAVRVNATDGYTQLYSYDNLYPNATIHNIQGDLILAFSCNGSAPPSWGDGPRIVFLPPDGNYSITDAVQTTPDGWLDQLSGGSRWVRNVTTIELLPNILVIDGPTKLNLALPQLVKANHVSGNAGFQNQLGNWRSYGTYVGVNLSAIIEEVGTMAPDDVVRVNSTDGLSQLYSYENVYPNATFYDLQGHLILAYSCNGTLAPSWDDGLRIVFLPADEWYSNEDANKTTPAAWFPPGSSAGSRWWKWVATIELLHGAFPPSPAEPSFTPTQDGVLSRDANAPVSVRGAPIVRGSFNWQLFSAAGLSSSLEIDAVRCEWSEEE